MKSAEIVKERKRLLEKLVKLISVELGALREACEHKNAIKTCHMGESCRHCNDCNSCDV